MRRLALAVVPFCALAGAAFAATPPMAPAAAPTHHRHWSDNTALARRETRALNLLEAKGYGDFTDFHAQGKDFSAQVDKNGRRVTVITNPDSGQVTQRG
jgi:hypothetical protein